MLPGVISLLQLQPTSQLMDHLGWGSRIRKVLQNLTQTHIIYICAYMHICSTLKLVRLPPEPRALPSLEYPAHQAHLPADHIDHLDGDHNLDIDDDDD